MTLHANTIGRVRSGRSQHSVQEKPPLPSPSLSVVPSIVCQITMNATTRSIMSSNSRRRRRLSNNGSRRRPWASLIPDLLIPILTQLGFIDFCACAGVCKDWRSITIDYRSTFLGNQRPLAFVKSKFARKGCFLYNIFDGTRYKTLLPCITSRSLLGLSCGYIIMLIDNKILLVNLITRNEIHFPMLPFRRKYKFRAVLFFSDVVSENLLLVFNRGFRLVMLSLSSRPEWHIVLRIGSFGRLVDIAYFNGYILVLTSDAKIGKLRLQYQTLNTNCTTLRPEHQSLNFFDVRINIPKSLLSPRHLVPSNDQLFMVSFVRQIDDRAIVVHRLDKTLMEWILVNDLGKDALFLSEGSCAVVNPTKWGGFSNCIYILPKLRNEWHMYFLNTCGSFWTGPVILEIGSLLQPYFWYFPHQIDDKNKVRCQEADMDL